MFADQPNFLTIRGNLSFLFFLEGSYLRAPSVLQLLCCFATVLLYLVWGTRYTCRRCALPTMDGP